MSVDSPAAFHPRAIQARGAVNRVVAGAGAAAALVGAIYLEAWLVGVPARWWAAGVVVMKTNMALALVLAGVALLLLRDREVTPRTRRVAAALAVIVLLVGGSTLVEHLCDVELGVDQLLASEPPGQPATDSPNRMGPPGALSLALVGAGLLALARNRRASAWLGAAVCAVALVPAVGMVYGVSALYRDAELTGIAWPTVVALLALGGGLALAESGVPGTVPVLWRADPGGALLRRMLLPVLLLPLVIGFVQLRGGGLGLYQRPVGAGLFAVTSSLLLAVLLWWSARSLSAADGRRVLAEQESRWRASLLDLAHDSVLVWSPDHGIESWNRGAEELYGYTAVEAVGRVVHELLQTAFPRPWPEIEAELNRTGRWYGELLHRTRDGRQVTVSARMQLVLSADGGVRVLETVRDVTEARRAQEALQQANAQLLEADRNKNEFLAALSHELRNPLAPIQNSVQVLERAPGGELAQRALQVIGRQVRHMARLVDELLDTTRISRGMVRLQCERVDLDALVRRTAEDHLGLYVGNGVTLEVRGAGHPIWVDGDPTRLAQVVGNLLSNSAKFTPRGGRTVLSLEANGSREAILRVRDDGAGIPAETLGRVFEPFVQGPQPIERGGGGLGLGLALVKSLVEMHGGRVAAHSAGEGTGTELTVWLPLQR